MDENYEVNQNIEENAAEPTEPAAPASDSEPKEVRSYAQGFLNGILISLAILIVVVICAAVVVVKKWPQLSNYTNVKVSEEEVADNTGLDLNKVKTKLQMIKTIVENRFLFEADISAEEAGIYKGYMDSLGDKYSKYYTEDEYKDQKIENNGFFGGIGAVISQSADGVLTIGRIYEGCPAEKAGLQVGDIIYYVDDLYAYDYSMNELVEKYIRGEPGTEVILTVLRGENKDAVEIEITRDIINIPLVESEVVDDSIGMIVVEQFTTSVTDQFISAVDDLINNKKVKGLIIDLRDNPGGMLMSAVNMAAYLLPDDANDGLITYTADKNGEGERLYAQDGHEVDVPIVILVNANSASASEVFTGAMMDGYPDLKVVGEQTFGKGIVQDIIPLGDGSAIKLTTRHYYTPTGFDLHGEGLKPDVLVELSPKCRMYNDENDNQFKKAKQLLSK